MRFSMMVVAAVMVGEVAAAQVNSFIVVRPVPFRDQVETYFYADGHGSAIASIEHVVEYVGDSSIMPADDGAPNCWVNPEIGKESVFTYESGCEANCGVRVSIAGSALSLADGVLLHTCRTRGLLFECSSASAWSPEGGEVESFGCVTNTTPTPTPTPTFTPTPTVTVFVEDEGCQVAGSPTVSAWLLLPVLGLLWRRRR